MQNGLHTCPYYQQHEWSSLSMHGQAAVKLALVRLTVMQEHNPAHSQLTSPHTASRLALGITSLEHPTLAASAALITAPFTPRIYQAETSAHIRTISKQLQVVDGTGEQFLQSHNQAC